MQIVIFFQAGCSYPAILMAAGASTTIHLLRTPSIVRIELCPPPGRPPTLEPKLLGVLDETLAGLHADPPRVVVLGSREPKYFCVGADLQVVRTLDTDTIEDWVRLGHSVFNRLEDLPCPTIAVIRGFALGGGLELALSCDLIAAAESARMGLPEGRLGLLPGWGGCRRLAERVGVATAKHWFFTGKQVDAASALRAGLVQWVAPDDLLDAEVESTVASIVEGGAVSMRIFKSLQHESLAAARLKNAEDEATYSRKCIADADTRSRVEAFFVSRSRRSS